MKTKLKASPDVNGVLRYDIPMTLSATELTTVKTSLALQNVNNTADADKPVSSATATALAGKEGTIAAGTTSQYWRGDKSWQDFMGSVRGSLLTGLSTSTNASISSGDTVLTGLGKAQAQIWGRVELTGNKIQFKNEAGNVNSLLRNVNATARTYDYPDKSGTVALMDDIPAAGNNVWALLGTVTAAADVAILQDLNIIPDGYEAVRVEFAGALNASSTILNFRVAIAGAAQAGSIYYPQFLNNTGAIAAGAQITVLASSLADTTAGFMLNLSNLANNALPTYRPFHSFGVYSSGGSSINAQNLAGAILSGTPNAGRVTGIQVFPAGGVLRAGSYFKVYGLKRT